MNCAAIDLLLDYRDPCRWCRGDTTLGRHDWHLLIRKPVASGRWYLRFACNAAGCNAWVEVRSADAGMLERLGVEVPEPSGRSSR